MTPLQSNFSPFHSPAKEKGKQGRIKGLTTVQWINLNWNNRSVLVHQYSVLWETIGPILPPQVGLTTKRQGGREGGQAGRRNMGGFGNFKLLYRLNYSDFYFVWYHCNFTAVLNLHSVGFYQVKVYFKTCFEVRKIR